MSDELIKVPTFLRSASAESGIMPMCEYCTEIACETDAMACGECSGQGCSGQCSSIECGEGCGQGGCGTCQNSQGCSDACEIVAQAVYTAPSFTVTNVTASSATINVTPGTGYSQYRIFARLTSDTGDVTYDATVSTSSSFARTIGGLAPKTSYTVNVCGVINGSSDKWAGAQTFVTKANNRPEDWAWWSVVARDQTINLTAAEWNALCNRIDEFRAYTGRGPWSGFEPVSSGTYISATVVNQARAAINPMGPTAAMPKYISPGDDITADYFNSLKDFLNSVP